MPIKASVVWRAVGRKSGEPLALGPNWAMRFVSSAAVTAAETLCLGPFAVVHALPPSPIFRIDMDLTPLLFLLSLFSSTAFPSSASSLFFFFFFSFFPPHSPSQLPQPASTATSETSGATPQQTFSPTLTDPLLLPRAPIRLPTMSDEELNRDWKPNGRRPQSCVYQLSPSSFPRVSRVVTNSTGRLPALSRWS